MKMAKEWMRLMKMRRLLLKTATTLRTIKEFKITMLLSSTITYHPWVTKEGTTMEVYR